MVYLLIRSYCDIDTDFMEIVSVHKTLEGAKEKLISYAGEHQYSIRQDCNRFGVNTIDKMWATDTNGEELTIESFILND